MVFSSASKRVRAKCTSSGLIACAMRSSAIPPPGIVLQRLRLNAAENCRAALLKFVRVSVLSHEKFIAASAMRHQGRQIALRAGREEQRARKPEALGNDCLQAIDGRIISVHIIAHFGSGHGRSHARGGLGDGVAAQIDSMRHGATITHRPGFRGRFFYPNMREPPIRGYQRSSHDEFQALARRRRTRRHQMRVPDRHQSRGYQGRNLRPDGHRSRSHLEPHRGDIDRGDLAAWANSRARHSLVRAHRSVAKLAHLRAHHLDRETRLAKYFGRDSSGEDIRMFPSASIPMSTARRSQRVAGALPRALPITPTSPSVPASASVWS